MVFTYSIFKLHISNTKGFHGKIISFDNVLIGLTCRMECQGKISFNIKQFIQIWIFLIGVGLLVWQLNSTIATFFAFRTTVAISKEAAENLPPPTIVLCQDHKWNNGFALANNKFNGFNVSDKDWIFKQFYRLNDKMNISIADVELIIGKNSFSLDEFNQQVYGGSSLMFMVKELFNPWSGLCYGIIPDPSTTPMKQSSYLDIMIRFSPEIENPIMSAYLINSEDLYGVIMDFWGDVKPLRVPLTELQTFIGIKIEERRYLHLQDSYLGYVPSSMTSCKDYSSIEDSQMKCRVKRYVENFESMANEFGCTCVPATHKSFFEIHPTSLGLEECKNNSEHTNCFPFLIALEQLDYKCPIPCQKVDYKGEMFGMTGVYQEIKDNDFKLQIKFNTMNIEIHNNVLIFDLATLVGTAGGSLGLFLGFSLTGFAEQVLHYFMRN